MNSPYKDCTVPSSYLVNQSNEEVDQQVMSLVAGLLAEHIEQSAMNRLPYADMDTDAI